MVGPVLRQELLLAGRRGPARVIRLLYAGWLLVLLLACFGGFQMERFARSLFTRDHRPFDLIELAAFTRSFLGLLLGQHFVVLALATPALAAGAITDEKARGTLQYLLTAALRPGEVVLGKLLGRCWQVLLLALPALPLIAFLAAFAGLDPGGLAALALASVLFVFALAAAALLASVWARQTRDAVLGLLAAGVLGALAVRGLEGLLSRGAALAWLPELLRGLDPLRLASSSWLQAEPAERWRRLAPSLAAWGGLGGACLALAAWRLRPAYFRQLEATGRKKLRWQPRRPPPGDDPVRWKERHVEGIAPLAVLCRLPRWAGVLLVLLATVVSSAGILLDRLPYGVTPAAALDMTLGLDLAGLAEVGANLYPSRAAFTWQAVVVLLTASLVVGIRCSGAITGERERQTWEALLLTPLPTRQLVRSKFWGVLGAGRPYLLAYAGPALALSAVGGLESFVVVAVALALTALALFYAGAAGLWCSARSRTSWRSLLGTLAFTYVGGCILFYGAAMLAGLLLSLILMALAILEVQGSRLRPLFGRFFEAAFFLAICVILVVAFFFLSLLLLRGAETWIAARERARHWQEERRYRRRAAPPR